ncbi:MAG: beta-lactamase family protein, partial [Williamsia herbipolensis]|nr:beta-lactamase family protein [Williamsia herbipolensis]
AEFAAELVGSTSVVGAVAATSRDGIVDVGTAGLTGPDGTPLRDDAVFRWTSITKPVLAATTLVLVERGVLGLTDPVTRWLPELADRRVLLDPAGELDATSPADRDITVRDLLTSQSGYGFTADFG